METLKDKLKVYKVLKDLIEEDKSEIKKKQFFEINRGNYGKTC